MNNTTDSRSKQMLLSVLSALGIFGLSKSQITSNATCLLSFTYLFNKEGQNPCLVAAYLGGACNGGQYDVSPLQPGEHYIGPAGVFLNPCQCSTVMYSMMGAYSTFQNGTIISWTAWSGACLNIYIGEFPEDIPIGTDVPAWAYSNVTTTNVFIPQVAIGDTAPESTGTIVQTIQTDAASVTPPPTIEEGSSKNCSSERRLNAGAIVGEIVGGVVLLTLIGVFTFLRRSKRQRIDFWSKSTESQARNVNALMLGADPYIFRTAARTNISDPDEISRHNNQRIFAVDGSAIRSKFNRHQQVSPEELGVSAASVVGTRGSSVVQEIPATANHVQVKAMNTSGIDSSRAQSAVVISSLHSNAIFPSRRDPSHRNATDSLVFQSSDTDAVSETVVEVDSLRGSAADSPRSESPASPSEHKFAYRAFVGRHMTCGSS